MIALVSIVLSDTEGNGDVEDEEDEEDEEEKGTETFESYIQNIY